MHVMDVLSWMNGYEQFKRLLSKDLFVWALRSRRIVTICLNWASQNFLTY